MKNYKLKYSVVFLSYVILVFLIIVSYVSIIPEEEVVIFENTEPLIKKKKQFTEEKIQFKILEKNRVAKQLKTLWRRIKKTNEEKYFEHKTFKQKI